MISLHWSQVRYSKESIERKMECGMKDDQSNKGHWRWLGRLRRQSVGIGMHQGGWKRRKKVVIIAIALGHFATGDCPHFMT